MHRKNGLSRGLVLAVLAWGLAAGAALAQVEQLHLRIDGMT